MLNLIASICIFSSIFPVYGSVAPNIRCDAPNHWKNDLPFCLSSGYNKEILPQKNSPVNISVLAHLIDVIEINDNDETVTLCMLLAVSWIDPGIELILNSTAWSAELGGGKEASHYSKYWLDNIWKPDLDMLNVKKFQIRQIMGEEQGFLRVTSDKRFWYEFPVEVTLGCPKFDFRRYPFDVQTCNMFIGSFQYDSNKNIYHGKVVYDGNKQQILQYEVSDIKEISFGEGLVTYKEYYVSDQGSIEYENVTYSHFGVQMIFRRRKQQYLLQTYLPSLLLVLSSWLGFLIEPSSVPGRISLSVMLLLCLITMSMDADRLTPRSQSVNALKIWMLGCTMMIIAALSEYGIILFMKGRLHHHLKCLFALKCKNKRVDIIKDKNENGEAHNQNIIMQEFSVQEVARKGYNKKSNEINESMRKLDYISLIIFPIIYFIFIIVYFLNFKQ